MIMNDIIISAEHISKSYPARENGKDLQVLSDVSLDIKKGSINAVVGPSGSGKSTLLHILGGLDSTDTGHIRWNDTDITAFKQDQLATLRNKFIGFVFQFHHLLPEFSAIENVAMPALISGKDLKQVEERAYSLLQQFGVHERAHHRPTQLSGGEQQRVSMARALMNNPEVILADEPTGNLDEANTNLILDMLFELRQQEEVTIVLITHEMDIARRADNLFELKLGQLQERN
jgi:lipoprotein-releasing system ATP-binding protein